ncbi:hypothetical protein [Bradymonas sediminis]|uniref:Uncharacterized protein n=1 Tax=Bradymonas sediminis TaxID=1548548 RepID=A0A2Z4FNZ6_9DELT|nr:hypothetical protein [Bradymonas sediminis]AWV90600.1 hypothetical protein DN745_15215 [Bradymonas sediminis]TDP62402.1 hypothetical protein DFR33_11365 [Bradymonas sediminis]
MKKYYFIYLAALLFSPLSACSCEGDHDAEWNLDDEWPEADAGEEDILEDDTAEEQDAKDEPIEPWEPEEVEPDIPYDHALTDRTSLDVDPDGTLWLGYHYCSDLSCSEPMLRVMHKRVGQDWVGEDIAIHEGIFGVNVIMADEPIVVYPDSFEPVYRVKSRTSDGQWESYDFPVPRGDQMEYDGFDVTENGHSYFITFAPDNAPQVSLFTLDVAASAPTWRELSPLEIQDSQAAMEDGLQTDEDNVYLVNLSGETGIYGVYRYDQELDQWPQTAELQTYTDLFVHSLAITQNFGLCMSGNYQGGTNVETLLVTCGSMDDLTLEVKDFGEGSLSAETPSSIIEGNDGTVYVAFNPPGNRELRVASRRPNTPVWEVETVYNGPSYGISTAIDHSGDLVISFYTCDDEDRCSLKVLWETMD